MIKKKDKEFLNGQMEENIEEIGFKVNSTVMVFTLDPIKLKEKENGMKARE